VAVLAAGILLLAVSFLVQLVVWRVALPRRQTHALLVLFGSAPVLVVGIAWATGHAPGFSAAQAFRVVLFYVSYALAYMVIYSAIENESPTLAIISHVAKAGAEGCDDADLSDRFGRGAAMTGRFALMESSGWVRSDGDRVRLSGEGRKYARFFDAAARIFGITKGG
jgi:hypothetical protein